MSRIVAASILQVLPESLDFILILIFTEAGEDSVLEHGHRLTQGASVDAEVTVRELLRQSFAVRRRIEDELDRAVRLALQAEEACLRRNKARAQGKVRGSEKLLLHIVLDHQPRDGVVIIGQVVSSHRVVGRAGTRPTYFGERSRSR